MNSVTSIVLYMCLSDCYRLAYLTETSDPHTCCDANQIASLNSKLTMLRQLLSRCPACRDNAVQMYCQFTCSPYQAAFMMADKLVPQDHQDTDVHVNDVPNVHHSNISEVQLSDVHNVHINDVPNVHHSNVPHTDIPHSGSTSSNASVVDSVAVSLSRDFAYGMFNACKDVQSPSSNQLALDVMCAKDPCTPQAWLNYMGDAKIKSPFQINFNITDTPYAPVPHQHDIYPLNLTTTPCNESCSCQDCKAVCTPLPPPPPKDPGFVLWGIKVTYWIGGGCFALFLMIFLPVEAFRLLYCYHQLEPQSVLDDDLGGVSGTGINGDGARKGCCCTLETCCSRRCGTRFELCLQRLFYRWGLVCANYPLVIITVMLVLCGALSAGIAKFEVNVYK